MYDVIVIGGGYIGCAIGYSLSKAGLKTLLIEQKEIGAYSSGGNYGCIQVQDANLGKSLEMTLKGFEKVMALEKEWGLNLDLVRKGSLIIGQTDAEVKELDKLYRGKKEAGLPVEYLTKKGIEEKEPYINSESILAATYMEQGELNPFKLMYGFISKGRSYGLTVLERKRVVSFLESGDKVSGVVLDTGETIESKSVVIAGGAFTRELGNLAGIDLPVDYIKGEAFVTESTKPIMNTYLSSAGFFTDAHGDDGGCTLALIQNSAGNFLVGETASADSLNPYKMNPYPTEKHIFQMSRKATELFPVLDNLKILRSFAVASPYTQDFNPLLGETKKKGLFVAAGFKSCVVMTLVVGEEMVNLLTGR